MKPLPKILCWVNCYGAWAPELRYPIETIGYDQYLDGVAGGIAALGQRVEVVYVSGGMIDQAGRTECETTIPELKQRLEARGANEIAIRSDEESVTSISIARRFFEVWTAEFSGLEGILFCDEARYETNAYTLEYLAQKHGFEIGPIHNVLVPIRRLDNHPDSTPKRQAEILKSMRQKGVEAIEKAGIDARKNRQLWHP